VRFGLAGVKHVSAGAVEMLAAERAADGRFEDIYEMCSRLEPGKLNKLALESLARAGALGSLRGSRAQQVAAADQALEWGARVYRDREAGQASLFGVAEGEGSGRPPTPELPVVAEFPPTELLAMEKGRLGAYLSGHPVGAAEKALRKVTTATIEEVAAGEKQGDVIVGGIITSYRKRVTRNGKMMAHFTLEDLTGAVEATLLPEAYERCGAQLEEQAIVVVRGRPESDDRWHEGRDGGGQQRLLADAIAKADDEEGIAKLRYGGNARSNRHKNRRPRAAADNENGTARQAKRRGRVHIRVPAVAPAEAVGRLKEMMTQFHGDTEVFLHVQIGEAERRLRLGREHWVAEDEGFRRAVTDLLGDGAIWVEQGPA
jgi:DNA polymerase III alpha subunit